MKHEDIKYDEFIEKCTVINPDIDYCLIEKALNFAYNKHLGQNRNSGEEFINHPVNVAYILVSMKLDSATICGGLLHDIIEDTDCTYQEIVNDFGCEIADMVEGLTKLQGIKYTSSLSKESQQAENYRKLLFSVIKDIRIILIKLADRLHNMRTLQFMTEEKRIRIAQETLDIYAPIANRFGISKIKTELEDLSLKFLHPEEYQKINKIVDQKKSERELYIKQVIAPLKNALEKCGIKSDIAGRSKHFYSIYRKKIVRKIPYDEIYDLAAIRIIVDTVEQCYSVLGVVHATYEPIEIFRDYIARPKPNGYQSLHTIVIGLQKRNVEIQIRTNQMHIIAEEGIASHWRYKELTDYSDNNLRREAGRSELQKSFKEQIMWIRQLLKRKLDGGNVDFIEDLKLDLYPEIIIAISPKNDFIKLPKNATPLDFAFAIHTDVGLRCIGAKVNGRIASLKTPLRNGDCVEILKSKKPNPSKDWLEIMKSSKAKQRLRAYLKAKELEDAIVLGQEIFIKNIRKNHLRIKTEEEILDIACSFKYNNINQLFADLGKGQLLFNQILEFLQSSRKIEPENKDELKDDELELDSARHLIKGIKIENIDNLMINYPKCCNPLPGDPIIAYTTRGRGITIHRVDCTEPNFVKLKETEPERFINVFWDYDTPAGKKNIYDVELKIVGENRSDMLLNILKKFSKFKIELDDAQMSSEGDERLGRFRFKIKDKIVLNLLIRELNTIEGIKYIDRTKK
ncbi:MAG: bifunctional (p)ppGpp synthetase/guanosine-3',5'-bis(diphosphate) 3'-pyrophosphohydrolase [Candidatus Cloacimonetes bacterium]|nr:bifunctional (p)ppGpp synthetase/guanosine-3',5'-bis(diphosphate) 3'-pyrophosphohydrolase [Candidatus Cloacimonadota bacterium]